MMGDSYDQMKHTLAEFFEKSEEEIDYKYDLICRVKSELA